MKILLTLLFLAPMVVFGQNYTSYFTGNPADAITSPKGGVCLMGGATEDDNAMKWFLKKASGGDVLVLRASGSNGYNDYLYSELGITVNSVESIVCHNAAASNESYIHQKIQQAEAIWFAGGDQWNYVSYWRNTPIDSLVNQAIQQRNVVVGGTSAGMVIMGKYYFSAQNGTVTSANALADPYHINVTVDSNAFISNAYLGDVITDTHFDNPDRRGRLMTFLARIYTDYGVQGKAIACDEYTAVCIEPDGIARVYGNFPSSADNAYFIQTNCELPSQAPENCTPGTPLTWNLDGKALKSYQVKGTSSGTATFNLNDWKTGTGGTWQHWKVIDGTFSSQSGTVINCSSSAVGSPAHQFDMTIYPNPSSGSITIETGEMDMRDCTFAFFNALGQQLPVKTNRTTAHQMEADFTGLPAGPCFLQVTRHDHQQIVRTIILKK